MSALWIGNFSFENQLIERNQISTAVQRIEAELSPCLTAAASSEDFILCPEFIPPDFTEHLRRFGIFPPKFVGPDQLSEILQHVTHIQPWGWTKELVDQFDRELKTKSTHPSLEAVKLANSRVFSFELSQLLNCLLNGENSLQAASSLDHLLQSPEFDKGFVLKENFGQSGRGQISGETRKLTEKQAAWAANRLEANRVLFLEPKLKSLAEFGIQWDLPEEGPPQLFGVTQLKSSTRGQFIGSIVRIDEQQFPELESIINTQRFACLEIQQIGYFGPVGIDAMIYEHSGGERAARPLQDINARWTMGRLAIHWANACFPKENNVSWIHSKTAPSTNAVRTSPLTLGGKPVQHQTWCHL
ncbi:hypothetical protein [Thalassoglobus polymorphus]|uniref:ATP-grasp domain-containing protein n=1 Tax=Thalassoglobus polymorphus TaxID=2527994 RepID=A0A517QMK5_9PLAN|nr:hypothetical protein [Thalassoglobus polymorphus]QDT32874.1 hypothetical protein Mal48_21220 [Thalassoglobus polymorphus]